MNMKEEGIKFILTKDQAQSICEIAGKEMNEMQDYEICEILDNIIDEFILSNS